MVSVIAKALALAILLGTGAVAPALAQMAARDGFVAACNGNPGFFDFAVTGLDRDPGGLARLCSCLVTEFVDLGDADYRMLAKDIDGTATTADRTAYGDYTALELKARETLDRCLVLEGFADGAPPAEMADMTKFDAACQTSAMLLEVIGGDDAGAAIEVRTTLCDCLNVALGPQVSTADADILAQDLDGTATDESRAAYANYTEASTRAGAAFDSCFATAMPAPPAQ